MSFDRVDPNVLNGEATDAHKSSGVDRITRTITFETEAADAIADIKALFRVGAHEIPLECNIVNDAIAGATDIDLGLYYDDETAASADVLMDGADISAGNAWASPQDGLSNLGVEQVGIESFYTLAGDAVGSIPNDAYWVAFTLNSDISAAGTITVQLDTIGR
jgi:hypothetical protein